jgi:hypothetical protein
MTLPLLFVTTTAVLAAVVVVAAWWSGAHCARCHRKGVRS